MSDDEKMARLVDEIRALSVPAQLRLAADLLDAKRGGLGRQVAHAAVVRLDAAALGFTPDLAEALGINAKGTT